MTNTTDKMIAIYNENCAGAGHACHSVEIKNGEPVVADHGGKMRSIIHITSRKSAEKAKQLIDGELWEGKVHGGLNRLVGRLTSCLLASGTDYQEALAGRILQVLDEHEKRDRNILIAEHLAASWLAL